MTQPSLRAIALASASCAVLAAASTTAAAQSTYFERIATYPVFLNLPEGVDLTSETVAEIVAGSEDGMILAYTDAAMGSLGLVDFSDPAAPLGLGHVALEGEPTSVAIRNGVALAGVNTSESYVEPSGHVAAVDLASAEVVATCALGGQPDSVAISPDGTFLAVAIENERDEDLNDGEIPQLPAGSLAVFTLGDNGLPTNCDSATIVDLTGLSGIATDDPEPEYVDINADNIAVVTLQENNGLALVDLAAGTVTGHFDAGMVSLDGVDVEDEGLVDALGSLADLPREPDAVSWVTDAVFATANEGDYLGGSRGFSLFDTEGTVLYDSGVDMENLGIMIGHYPDGRADNKGMEPEGVEVGTYGEDTLLFVNAERGNVVAVYAYNGADAAPTFLQVLPTAVGPEGLLAIPSRDLLVVATEVDEHDEGIRSTLSIYARTADMPTYPELMSQVDADTGRMIGWGALSGLAADADDAARLYAVSDSAYAPSRIFTIDAGQTPAQIVDFVDLTIDGTPVALDLEGIAPRAAGGFWLVSEGHNDRALDNMLMAVSTDGAVSEIIMLPEGLVATQTNNGFEGVTAWTDGDGVEHVMVAIQREWGEDPENHVRLGAYTPSTGEWGFVHTPIAEPTSPNGGWVGLSEVVYVGNDSFLLIERDNQDGVESTHKVLTMVSLAGVTPVPYGEEPPVLERTVVLDLLPVLRATNGWIGDKPEGLTVAADGTVYLVTDNDGVDDASGETQFIALGTLEDLM